MTSVRVGAGFPGKGTCVASGRTQMGISVAKGIDTATWDWPLSLLSSHCDSIANTVLLSSGHVYRNGEHCDRALYLICQFMKPRLQATLESVNNVFTLLPTPYKATLDCLK